MQRIRALDPDVVQKIAAGEVIVSPANALKELIENSLDAGASNIDVVVKEGGHKLLQITDNGHGIDEEDLPILCQRFTTSKISNFNDLETVQTLGFRGEALASISHIAHVSVKTKTNSSKTAVLAQFEAGELISTKKAAGVQGTQISVEDLFFNVPLRLRAFQSTGSKTAEYQKILDVVSKYAIQYPGTFSCKRVQDTQPVVIPDSSRKDKIKKVFGLSTFQELLEFRLEPEFDLGVKLIEGFVTGLNYTTKRAIPFIFFINKRLVSCEPLSRAIRKTYQEYLPRGSNHAFVFLSLELEPVNIDVNIHPTKREVHFLHQDEIIEQVCEKLKTLLTLKSGSRDYYIQSYISATTFPPHQASSSGSQALLTGSQSGDLANLPVPPVAGGIKPRYAYNLVRTDPRQPRITAFARRPTSSQPLNSDDHNYGHRLIHDSDEEECNDENDFAGMDDRDANQSRMSFSSDLQSTEDKALTPPPLQFRDHDLESVKALIDGIKERSSAKLLELFSEHTFVGLVDPNRGLAAIQLDVRLYLVKYNDVFREIFYQLGLTQFANFGTIHLGDGLPLHDLLQLAQPESTVSLDAVTTMAPMLEEYFQIVLKQKNDQWVLTQVPLMLPGYTPPVSRFARFFADLATKVSWEYERECLEGIVHALADLHVPTSTVTREEVETVFDAAKASFVPSRSLVSCVIEIASLPGLYKVFERC